MRSSDPPLGVLPGFRRQDHREGAAPGQTLVVVSDGFLDCFAHDTAAIRAAARPTTEAATPSRPPRSSTSSASE